MRIWPLRKAPVVAIAAVTALWFTGVMPASAPARSFAPPHQAGQFVKVNVSFNTQFPLVELDDQSIAAAQKTGRKLVYRAARAECTVLKSIIAKTCRLTNLNVSTQIRRHNNRNPTMLNINGSAQFSIELKKSEGD